MHMHMKDDHERSFEYLGVCTSARISCMSRCLNPGAAVVPPTSSMCSASAAQVE